MKIITVVLLCVLAFTNGAAQSPCEPGTIGYAACVVIDDIWWKNGNEWDSKFHAELYLDGILQPPSSSYRYVWMCRENGDGEFTSVPARDLSTLGTLVLMMNTINTSTFMSLSL